MSQGISVIVPLYNHVRYIRQSIESVLLQGDIVREVIVIDDGSTDGSIEVMRDLAGLDRRIVFSARPNQGAHQTISTGLMHASSPLLAILNSDDMYAPGRLTRLAAALELDAGADLACSSIGFIDGDGMATANAWHAEALDAYKASGQLGLSLMNANFVMTTSNIVMRRRLIGEIGLMAPLRYAHDLDFLLRAAANGRRLAFIDEPLLSYRWHGTNTIKEDAVRVKREWAMCCGHYVHLVRTSPRFTDLGWGAVEEMLTVFDRHGLTRAVQCCLLYFDRHPVDTLEHSRILTDPGFQSLLTRSLA